MPIFMEFVSAFTGSATVRRLRSINNITQFLALVGNEVGTDDLLISCLNLSTLITKPSLPAKSRANKHHSRRAEKQKRNVSSQFENHKRIIKDVIGTPAQYLNLNNAEEAFHSSDTCPLVLSWEMLDTAG